MHVTFTPATWEVTIDTRVPSCAITTALIPPYPKPPRLFGIGDQFVGYIDDVRVWNRTLSPMEMAQYLTRGVCVSDADGMCFSTVSCLVLICWLRRGGSRLVFIF